VCFAPGSQDLVQRDWPKPECIDTDVILSGHRLQFAMRVTVQVDRALAHLVPSAECIVAKNEPDAVYDEFGVALDALPLRASDRICIVVVADDQMLPAIQSFEQDLLECGGSPGEVSEVPDLVIFPDDTVPCCHQRFVVRREIGERTSVYAKDSRIIEMRVGGKEDHSGNYGALGILAQI
jgi:hypothetical protein